MVDLQEVAKRVRVCTDCPLARTRTNAVPGEGNETPRIVLIGEAPGYHEDQQGRPFVGPAGKFLEQLLGSIGLKRQDVFITNMVKCRPPNNREPLPTEIEACRKYLDRQIELLHPDIIVTLGRHSLAKFFPKEAISKARGKARTLNEVLIFPTYHPAAALHQQSLRHTIEEDFKVIPSLLNAVTSEKETSEAQQLSMF